jgi:hypothetical protein
VPFCLLDDSTGRKHVLLLLMRCAKNLGFLRLEGIRMQKRLDSDPPNTGDAPTCPAVSDPAVFYFPDVVDDVPSEASDGIGSGPAA